MNVVTYVRSLVAFYRERDVGLLAGSVAYSAFLSLIPLILLLLIVAQMVGGAALRQYVLSIAEQYLTPGTLGVVEQAITQSSANVQFSILGLVTLLWAVLKVFRTLDKAFSNLYEVTSDPGIVEQMTDAAVVLGVMTVAIMVMLLVGALVPLADTLPLGTTLSVPVTRVLSFVTLVVGLTVAFLVVYYFFPDVDVSLREALPGAIFAAVGWTVLQALFQVYVSFAQPSQLYGVIGGIILFITWLYFGAVVILLGAATNIILSDRRVTSDVGLRGESATGPMSDQ